MSGHENEKLKDKELDEKKKAVNLDDIPYIKSGDEESKIAFDPKRDWVMGIMVLSLLFVILLLSFPSAPKEVKVLFEGISIGLIGMYGTIRGRGKKNIKKIKSVKPINRNRENTFGLPSGLVRGCFFVVFLIWGAIIGIVFSRVDNCFFLVVLAFECLSTAFPGFFPVKINN